MRKYLPHSLRKTACRVGRTVKTEEVWIECEDAKLYGEVYTPEATRAPALLICHGLNARGFHQLKIYSQLAKVACEKGFVTLAFDFRGVGKSEGRFDYGVKERKDVKCAVNYLASRRDVINDRIYVVGHSLGGAVSLYALQNEKRVKGLVLWSVPKNHDYNVRKFIKNSRGSGRLNAFLVLSRIDKLFDISRIFEMQVYGVDLRPKDVREKLMKLDECEAASKMKGIPLLVINGENDTIVGTDEAEAVYNSANEPKSLLILNSTDHIFRGKEDELVQKTMEWIINLDGQS
jgi:alpha/beta superfamily hydrolase